MVQKVFLPRLQGSLEAGRTQGLNKIWVILADYREEFVNLGFEYIITIKGHVQGVYELIILIPRYFYMFWH